MKINRKKLLFYSTYFAACSLIGFLIALAMMILLPLDKTGATVCGNVLISFGFICLYMHMLAIPFAQYLLQMEKPYRRLLFWWCLTAFFPLVVCPILYRRHRREFEAMLKD